MPLKKNEKLLSADVNCEIVDKFLNQASKRGFTKKRVLAAAAKLWTEIPLELQAQLLSEDVVKSSFTELVRQIVDEQIEKAEKGRKK